MIHEAGLQRFGGGAALCSAVFAVVLSASAGCSSAPAPVKLDSARVTRSSSDGILGLVVASQLPIREFTLRGPNGRVYTRAHLGDGAHLLLFQLPAGRYCLAEVSFGKRKVDIETYGSDVCFYPISGVIGYVGHYFLTPGSEEDAQRFDRLAAFRTQLAKQRPELVSRYKVVDLLEIKATLNRLRAYPGLFLAQSREGHQ